MNLYSKEFCPEIWDAWMKKMFLDPFTTILDDTQFRVDLFETTNEIIIEICIEDLNPTECFIKKDGKDLMIFLRMPGKRDRYRKITFPFELDYHFVQATWEKEWIEVVIDKSLSEPSPISLLRFSAPQENSTST